MKKTIAAILIAFASGVTLAFDPLSVELRCAVMNDDAGLAFTLLYYRGHAWTDNLDAFAEKLGNEKVGERIVEFVEPVFGKARGAPLERNEIRLCRSGILALGHLMATNSLPFLEKAVLHGGEQFCHSALISYRMITDADDSYIDLLDRVVVEGAISQDHYMFEIGRIFFEVHNGKLRSTPEHRLRIAIRLINNPDGYYLGGCERDNMLLADFPSYTNSVERLVALSAFLGNECTPPEVRAKYEPERDRLRALPPESLIRVTDELEVQLDVILKAAEREENRARIKKVAIPAGVAVLVLAGLTVLFRHRVIHKGKGMREEAAQERH